MAKITNLDCGSQGIKTLKHTPGSAVAADDILLIGTRVCVAYADVAASEEGNFIHAAEYLTAPKAAVTIAEGEIAYWDNAAALFTNVATANTKCGMFVAPAASGDATAQLELNNSVAL